ncbi:galactokinase [Cecembia rubra]|uniref:Galactokinase n=1 Tax=Cecembia rubra TaxID=1485585 RepID=A0A2P8ECG2_9BACT|nr:galactokinase [Cecembia rubra]PSL07163.1 galactokinase [Cecembia rubra]
MNPYIEAFKQKFNYNPSLFRSPGRINLIGDHTDYNDGYVLPAAIDKGIYLAISLNDTNHCRIQSLDFEDEAEVELSQDLQPATKGWLNYILGVIAQFQSSGYQIKGFDCVFGGDIPIGAGLSSSAALECVTVRALMELHGIEIPLIQQIQMAQKAEHEFAGVKCGIMDQFASAMGKAGQAIQLDCRTLDFQYIPVHLEDFSLILVDSKVKHNLGDSAYNKRQQECQEGFKLIQNSYPGIRALRDVDSDMLLGLKPDLDPIIFKRCKHVVSENQRVLHASAALKNGNLKELGRLMFLSHFSLSNDYQVSCNELDFLVNVAQLSEGVLGARMMGGGFGGCTINLIHKDYVDLFKTKVSSTFYNKFSLSPGIYEVSISEGTSRIHCL